MLIPPAWAQDAAAGNDVMGMVFSYLPIVLIFVIFYVLILRPQTQAAKQHAALVAGLKKGDVVLTDGGLVGEVEAVDDDLLRVFVGGTAMVVARAAVRKVLADDARKQWHKLLPAEKKR